MYWLHDIKAIYGAMSRDLNFSTKAPLWNRVNILMPREHENSTNYVQTNIFANKTYPIVKKFAAT